MVETSTQPRHFLGNAFLGEGFKPVFKHATASAGGSSLFTIDSILAPRPKPASPQRPAMQHPSLHLGHIAAAGGFGAASADFFGTYLGPVGFGFE